MRAPCLRAALPVADRFALDITWQNGRRHEVDLKDHIQKNPQLHPLLDLNKFSQAVVGEWGYGVYWADGIEISAAVLFRLART